MASPDRRHSHDQPARLPKLHIRNRPSESSTSELLPLEEITPCPVKASASVPRDRDARPRVNSTAHTVRTGTEKSSGTATATDSKSRKKSNPMRDFFAMKEPSSSAIEEYKRQQKQQAGGRPEISPLQKLPPHVPPVNSKWDGLPKTTSHSSNNHRRHPSTKSTHTHTRQSSAQTQISSRTTTSTASSSSHHHHPLHSNPYNPQQYPQPPPSPLTASTMDFDFGPPPSRATTNTTTNSLRLDSAHVNTALDLGLNFTALHLPATSMSDSVLPSSLRSGPAVSASASAASGLTTAVSPFALSAPATATVSTSELQVIAPWAEPPPSPSPLPRPMMAEAVGAEPIPEVRLPVESERLLRGSIPGGAAGVGGRAGGFVADVDAEGPLVLNPTPRLPSLGAVVDAEEDSSSEEEMGALRRLERVVVRGGRGGRGRESGVHGENGSGHRHGKAPSRSHSTRAVFARIAGKKR